MVDKNHQIKHGFFCLYTRFFLLFLVRSAPTEPKLHSILTFLYPVYTVTTWDTQGRAESYFEVYIPLWPALFSYLLCLNIKLLNKSTKKHAFFSDKFVYRGLTKQKLVNPYVLFFVEKLRLFNFSFNNPVYV